MARLSIDQFVQFFRYYRDEPHQRLAVAELWKKMPVSLLEEDAGWILTYRDPAVDENPDVPITIENKPASENSWWGVYAAAKRAGAKFPECVAAQWALESGWGEHTSGQNNFFGVKATGGEPYSSCTTWEVY
ncbi:MAG: glucosaminidase domain-containing protein, partial [Synechococcus sp.]